MKKIYWIFILTTLTLRTYGQKVEKVFLDKSDTTKNYYTIVYSENSTVLGYLVLIPGFGERPEIVLQQTTLPLLCAQKGIVTIIPTLKEGVLSFGIDDISQQSLVKILENVTNNYNLKEQKLYIGGFSIGGSAAVKYAENAFKNNLKVKPVALFAIDPPLDFERFYNSSKRDIRLSVNAKPSRENLYMINRIVQVMGGTPKEVIENYHGISPYSFSDTTQQAIKFLINIPIRIYSEPDINWWIGERRADVSSMNVLDCSAMINELRRLGNKKAELITTNNKGYREPNHVRHPHSWSIVDNNSLIDWLLKQ